MVKSVDVLLGNRLLAVMLMLMSMKHIYLCAKSCNTVSTAARCGSSLLESGIVEVTATVTSGMTV